MDQKYPNSGAGFEAFERGDSFEFEGMPTCCGCSECGYCCKAMWCPCFSMCDIMTEMGMWSPSHPSHGNCSKNIHIWTGCCLTLHWLTLPLPGVLAAFGGESAGALAAVGALLAFMGKMCFMWPLCWMRQEVGKQFNIPVCQGAGCLLDCCCPWYCWCWTMNQERVTAKTMMNPEGLVQKAIKAGLKVVKAAL